MKFKDFFTFKHNKLFWWNIIGMITVVVLLIGGTFYFLDVYTQHGQAIKVPDVKGESYEEAAATFEKAQLRCEAVDYIYVKGLPENSVVEQRPAAEAKVKRGRTVYLTLSTKNEPTFAIPDIVDNCSLREAEAKLQAAGFKLTLCDTVSGERDWVYGLRHGNKELRSGDKLPAGSLLTLIIGNGEEISEPKDSSQTEATVDGSWFE